MIQHFSAQILVVAYNTRAADSKTIQALGSMSGCANVDIVIRDNSSKRNIFDEDVEMLLSRFSSVRVDWDGDNVSLSKLYNDISECIGEQKWLILLDDDTELPEDYLLDLSNVDNCALHVDMALPVVMCGERIVSPGEYRFVKGQHWKVAKRGVLPSASFAAITSGMAIRSTYLREYSRPFDERLTFYGIDTRLCLDYRSRRTSIYVTKSTLQHDSALWKDQNSDERLRRFKTLKRATYQIHEGNLMAVFALIGLNFISSIRRAIKFRDVRYIL